MEYLIRTYTDEGDVVLDNCIGSGTTAVAAIRTGRHYIGFEIEQVYCEIAERRIQEELECRNKSTRGKRDKGRKTKINKSMTWTKRNRKRHFFWRQDCWERRMYRHNEPTRRWNNLR